MSKRKQKGQARKAQKLNSSFEKYKRRYLELCNQFEVTTNPTTRNALKAQIDNICNILSNLTAK